MPMFSEAVIKQTVEAVRVLWNNPSKLEGDFQTYHWGNGHPHTVLKSPEEVGKLLRMSEQEAVQQVFGMGGNGYVTPRQQIDRFRWHMCISFYRWEGAAIPQEVKDKIEHLTQMDEEDAKYWSEVYETTQWDVYDQSSSAATPAQPAKVKKKHNIAKHGTLLFVVSLLPFLYYLYQFVKGISSQMGIFYESPLMMQILGALAFGFVTFAWSLRGPEGGGFVIFLFVAALVFSIFFCGSVYGPVGFLEKALWMNVLRVMAIFTAAMIAGWGLGSAALKHSN